MTKERIAEIRRDIDECNLGVSFLKADLRECLDEIERLQIELAKAQESIRTRDEAMYRIYAAEKVIYEHGDLRPDRRP